MSDPEVIDGGGGSGGGIEGPLTKPEVSPSGTEERASKPPPRKRRRVVISCLDCHKRKQRCDRKLPCTNCVSRGKQDGCRYETGTPLSRDQQGRKGSAQSSTDRSPPDSGSINPIPIKPADFGYSSSGGGTASTLGFLKKIEGVGAAALSHIPAASDEGEHYGSRERYKSLVRHLPARTFVELLVDIYFRDFNWMYYTLDEAEFHEHLEQWYQLPFHLLSNAGPQGIEPILRSFPALLFQVLGTSLLALADENEERFVSLKYAGSMTFEDLAMEYSETGVAILSLLGKRQMTVTTVLAGWMRAAFLKYTGQVTEAWHQVGTAIRDAQEIGLHRDQFDPQPNPSDSAEQALESMWSAQSRRRIWMTLVAWDLHTGAVLGRPTSVDFRTLKRSEPVDAPIPKDRRKTPVFPRGEHDHPTPLTRALWSYQIMKPLRDILDLEKEGPFPKDFSKVEKLHKELVEIQERTPAYFRLQNPDTQYDDLPECHWLPQVRPTLPQLTAFNFMALHRPYIFTRASSRFEALKASLDMLEAQRVQFSALHPLQYKTFSLFFGTFDAIVMMASIYILFPKEHPELLNNALQHFHWGVERFEAMAERNRLAGAALGVLNAIYIRLKKAIGHGFLNRVCPRSFVCPDDCKQESSNPDDGSPSENRANSVTTVATGPSPTDQNACPLRQQQQHQPSVSSTSGSSSTIPPSDTGTVNTSNTSLTPGTEQNNSADMFAAETTPDWSFPPDFDFSSLPPMYPMGDVAYNDLTGIRDEGGNFFSAPAAASQQPLLPHTAPATGAMATGWPSSAGVDGTALGPNLHGDLGGGNPNSNGNPGGTEEGPFWFGGEFGNDTIWNLLNQFPPF